MVNQLKITTQITSWCTVMLCLVADGIRAGYAPPMTSVTSFLNPISMGLYLADSTYNFLDFTKESRLCPDRPAVESEWEEDHYNPEDWPGIIFFTPGTHEDVEIYYDRSIKSFNLFDINTDILQRGFNPELPTIIYLHAFTQHPLNKWLRTVRQEYTNLNPTNEPKINLMFFDYKKFAALGYAGSAKWVPALGGILAKFIDQLIDVTQIDPMKLHLISFSLGTHICGMAGRRSNHTIGRITALDPAGWCFSERYPHNYTEYGLRATDAYQVDVKHFDINFLGTRLPVGNIDIYMNGGAAQPGCSSGYRALVNSALGILKIGKQRVLGEGHSRAAVHSVVPLDGGCHEIAYECSTYEAFQAGECGECDQDNNQCFSTNIYGVQEIWSHWRAPRQYDHYKKMFINTGSKPPFCVQHYQIRVNIKGHDEFERLLAGELTEKLWQDGNEVQGAKFANVFKTGGPQIVLHDEDDLEWFATAEHMLEHEWRPMVFTALAMNQGNVHKTLRARLVMKNPDSRSVKQLLEQGIDSVQVNYMSHVDYDDRRRFSTTLCPDHVEDGQLWLVECHHSQFTS